MPSLLPHQKRREAKVEPRQRAVEAESGEETVTRTEHQSSSALSPGNWIRQMEERECVWKNQCPWALSKSKGKGANQRREGICLE